MPNGKQPSNSQTSVTAPQSGTSSASLVAPLAAGCAAGALLLGGTVVFWMRRRRAAKPRVLVETLV